MNIVIVEDDINMRKSLEIALGEYDELNIKSYKSAVEALKRLGEDMYELGFEGIKGANML